MATQTKFTSNEKFKMDEYLDRKYLLEEKQRVLQQQLQDVGDAITEMQAGYGAIYNTRTPVLNLPVEVTCLIFTYAQLPRMVENGISKDDQESSEDEEKEEEEEEEEENEGAEDEEAEDEVEDEEIPMEIVVSQVCRRWRSICLEFPKLWTTFYYDCESHPDVPLDRFDVYMDRSTSLPLRIWLDLRENCENPDYAVLLQKAIKQVHRWQHFTIFSDDLEVIQPLHELCDLSAPLLECLSITGPVDEEVGEPMFLVGNIRPDILTKGAPRLTYLRLDGYTMRHNLPPLSNITILRLEKQQCDSLECFDLEGFVELLSLPTLNQLSLSGDLIEAIGDLPIIQMPNLKRFRVSELYSIWDLLPCIRAPQLNTLIIHMCQYRTYGIHAPSQDPSYAFPALHKLYVIDCDVTSSIGLAFTQLTGEASDILISSEAQEIGLLQTILDGGYANIVWPRLKILSLNVNNLIGSNVCTEFAMLRRKQSFTYRIHPALIVGWEVDFEALKAISLVELDENGWELNEPFWPQEACSELRYDFGQDDEFSIRPYFD